MFPLFATCQDVLRATDDTDQFIVDAPIIETRRGSCPERPLGTYSKGVSRVERMEGNSPESIPAAAEKGKEGQE